MTVETKNRVEVENILFKCPIPEEPDKIAEIRIGRKRFAKVAMIFQGFAVSDGSTCDKEMVTIGNNVANALMPGYVNDILEKVLTPSQYQRALEANQSGKILKFALAGS